MNQDTITHLSIQAMEITLKVSSWSLLAKGVRPLPFGKEEVDEQTGEKVKHGGFTDVAHKLDGRCD